jgi:hypothetical protein
MSAIDGVGEEFRSPQPRKLVSAERLLRLLNQRLEGYGHCHGCTLAGPIRRLAEPADDGRNWSRFIPLVCGTSAAGGCVRLAERIIDDASREYNLWDED